MNPRFHTLALAAFLALAAGQAGAQTTLGTGASATESGDVALGDFSTAAGYFWAGDLGLWVPNGLSLGDLQFATAVGAYSYADGAGATAFGSHSTADAWALALGLRANAAEGAAAIGTGASATGEGSTAVGSHTNASGSGAFAAGLSSTATGSNSIAIGNAAISMNDYSVAIGSGALATDGGIAVGRGSVAGAGEFSVGNVSGMQYRRITGVANATGAHDAVTLQQMQAAIAAIPVGGGGTVDQVARNLASGAQMTANAAAASAAYAHERLDGAEQVAQYAAGEADRANGRLDALVLGGGSGDGTDLVARDLAHAAQNTADAAHTRIDTLGNRVTTEVGRLDGRVDAVDAKADTALTRADDALATAHETQEQVAALTDTVTAFDGRISTLERQVAGLGKRIDAAAASGAAMMNAQPPALAPGERAVVAGLGASGSQAAFAIGLVGSSYVGQTFGVRVAFSSRGKPVIGAGVGFKF